MRRQHKQTGIKRRNQIYLAADTKASWTSVFVVPRMLTGKRHAASAIRIVMPLLLPLLLALMVLLHHCQACKVYCGHQFCCSSIRSVLILSDLGWSASLSIIFLESLVVKGSVGCIDEHIWYNMHIAILRLRDQHHRLESGEIHEVIALFLQHANYTKLKQMSKSLQSPVGSSWQLVCSTSMYSS